MNIRRAGDVSILDDAVGELNDGGGILAFEVRGLNLTRAAFGVSAGNQILDLIDIYLRGVGFFAAVESLKYFLSRTSSRLAGMTLTSSILSSVAIENASRLA